MLDLNCLKLLVWWHPMNLDPAKVVLSGHTFILWVFSGWIHGLNMMQYLKFPVERISLWVIPVNLVSDQVSLPGW